MIKIVYGDLLQANVEALVNTVNTSGVMGKGLAQQFKQRYPDMFKEYQALCEAGAIEPGQVHVFERHGLLNPKFIINFPTKRHWRERTKLDYIQTGLKSLLNEVKSRDIRSLAIPALGTGLGGLDWSEVRPLIEKAFESCSDITVLVYPPQAAPNHTEPSASARYVITRPQMTLSRAIVLRVLDAYHVLGYELSLLEVHKLLYFLQLAGEPLKLNFEQGHYGPYATNLRHVLNRFEGHFIQGFTQDAEKPGQLISLMRNAVREAKEFLDTNTGEHEQSQRLNRVLTLIEGFESPYGLELLSSVHWVATQQDNNIFTVEDAIAAVQKWNQRKQEILKSQHIQTAWDRLYQHGWLNATARVGPENHQAESTTRTL